MKNIHNRSIAALRMAPAPWFARLEAIANDAEIAAPAEAGALLARLHAMIVVAPPADGDAAAIAAGVGPGAGGGADIAALIASGGETSAALALLPRRAGWMLSSGAAGDLFLATLVLPGMLDEVTAQGASPALALIAAAAMAMAGGRMLIDPHADGGADPRFA